MRAYVILTAVVVFSVSVLAGPARDSVLFNGGPVRPDQVLVAFKPNLPVAVDSARGIAADAIVQHLNLPGACRLQRNPYARLLATQAGRAPDRLSRKDLDDPFFVITLNDALPLAVALDRLKHHPWIAYAEPDPIGQGGDTVPTDPSYGSQWHHPRIQTPKAWDITQGSSDVTVAVLDTGLNTGLSEFWGRVVPGYDFVNSDASAFDDHGHGTAVTGALAANANNGSLVAGVDWNCRIMPVKVLDESNLGSYSWWAAGIDYAVANGADVINLSAGGLAGSTTVSNAVLNAIDAGVVFVTITHNDGTSTIRFPGSMLEPITVGAADVDDTIATFSNTGPQIDLTAPGVDIYTVGLNGDLQFWYGTSFAAPLVSGVAALLKAIDPTINHYRARTLLCAGAKDLAGGPPIYDVWDPVFGWGRLNAWHTLQLATEHAVFNKFASPPRVEWTTPGDAPVQKPYRLFETTDPALAVYTNVTSEIVYGASSARVETAFTTNLWHFFKMEVYVPPSGLE